VPLALLVAIPTLGQPVGDLAAHRTEQEVTDSLRKALPFLEDKVASTIVNGASTPIAFHGEVQFRSYFHKYYNLVDSSYLSLTEQGFKLGGDEQVIKLGMIVTPNRNTVMYARMGLRASYHGVNSNPFLNPYTVHNPEGYEWKEIPSVWSPVPTHHYENKSAGISEDMSAGIAIRTPPASFQLQMGAMNWNEASPLSIWKAQSRMFGWEYLPYESEAPIADYYRENIAIGEKTGRAAWNKKAFQGIDFKVTNLPGDIKGYIMYGVANPYDTYQRNGMDMATDLGFEGDGGHIGGTGIGDSYRKHLFYRVTKKFMPELTVGFNNGYIFTSTDIIRSGYNYNYIFNSNFNVGRYNSIWDINGERVSLKDSASLSKIVANAATSEKTALAIGEGYLLDPKSFSVDFRGNIDNKFSYMADIGLSIVDTTFIAIAHEKDLTVSTGGRFSKMTNSDGVVTPGSIESIRTVNTWKDGNVIANNTAAFFELTYHSKAEYTLDMVYAGSKFGSPYSFISDIDGFFARGSNLLGAGKFLGEEASPYTSNMFATGLTVKPEVPWYGHLKFKYGMNSQISAGRDILFFPYRLNGDAVLSSLNSWYSKWGGAGKVTQMYYFENEQTHALAPVDRVGDESYGSLGNGEVLSPTSGGLRADAHTLYEGFVPYTKAKDVIFNHFAKSSLVQQDRDLSEIWDDDALEFVDRRNDIDSVRIVDGKDTSYYSMVDNSDTLIIRDANGTVTSRKPVTTSSATGFVPTTKKSSFNFAFDWALDLSEYVGYKNDLFLSIYYEINGVTRSLKPLAVSADSDDVMMMSHYIRSEPAIALTNDFYLLGLIGFERWIAGTSWVPEYTTSGREKLVGFRKEEIKTTDLALGVGFDWDFAKRVSFHGRYKWFTHKDAAIAEVRYNSHAIAFELKAFF